MGVMKLNTVIQGDALHRLGDMPPAVAQCIIADPPYYNVLPEHGWDVQWESAEDYISWCQAWVEECMRVLRPDGLCFIFGQVGKREHTFLHLMSELAKRHQFHDLVIWDRVVGYDDRKDSFTPQYEMVLVLRGSGKTKFIKDAVRIPYDDETIRLYMRDNRYKDMLKRRQHLEKGKFATNILSVPSLKGVSKEKCGHPSQKPEALIEKLIVCSTEPGDVVLDPFLGSGTSALIAALLKRQWVGIERDPKYVQMARKRLKDVMPDK